MDAEDFWQEVKDLERDSGFKTVTVRSLNGDFESEVLEVYLDWNSNAIVIEVER